MVCSKFPEKKYTGLFIRHEFENAVVLCGGDTVFRTAGKDCVRGTGIEREHLRVILTNGFGVFLHCGLFQMGGQVRQANRADGAG